MSPFYVIIACCLIQIVTSAFAPTPALPYDHIFDKADFYEDYDYDDNCICDKVKQELANCQESKLSTQVKN